SATPTRRRAWTIPRTSACCSCGRPPGPRPRSGSASTRRTPATSRGQQHGVGVRHLAADHLAHLVAPVGEVPLVRRLHHAVERYEFPCHDLAHARSFRTVSG